MLDDVLTEIHDELGEEAIAQARLRSKDETFLQAAKRMGAEGLYQRRQEIIWDMDKAWEDACEEPSLETIKKDIIQESKENHEDYVRRAERIMKTTKEKYLPGDWTRQSDEEDEEEEHRQAQARVRLMYDNIFGDALSFEPIMG